MRQLAALVAIADHGTFSAAARALYTVQSNVSSHIAHLEKELGVVLVDRAQGGLTDDGTRVVERARRILRELDDISADVAPVTGDVTGDVRIGMLGTTARWLLPALLPTLTNTHPQVRAIVSEGSTSVLLPALLAGRFNAAVVHLPVDDPELTIEPLFAENLVLVTSAATPWPDEGDPAVRTGPPRPAPPAVGIGAPAGPRPGGGLGRRAAPRPGGDRRGSAPRFARRRRARHGDPAGDGDPPPAGERPRRRPGAGAAATRRRPRPPAAPGPEPADPRACSRCSGAWSRPGPRTSPASASAPRRSPSAGRCEA